MLEFAELQPKNRYRSKQEKKTAICVAILLKDHWSCLEKVSNHSSSASLWLQSIQIVLEVIQTFSKISTLSQRYFLVH